MPSSLPLAPRRAALLFTLALATLTLAACDSKRDNKQDTHEPSALLPSVATYTVAPRSVTFTRELSGRVRPFLIAEVRPQVAGIVRERMFREGSFVEAGEALYQLDDASYRAEHDSAVAERSRAEAALYTARLNAERADNLIKTNAISKRDFDNAHAALLQARADLNAATAQVNRHKIELDYARITAPISGFIGRSAVTRGALTTASQAEPLAVIQQLDPVYVDLHWSSRELLDLRQEISAGQLEAVDNLPVDIHLENGSLYQHTGKLSFSEMTVDPATGSVNVRVEVPNPENLLLPGTFVRAAVTSGRRDNTLLVPQRGVTRNAAGQASVLLVNSANVVERRNIELGRTLDNQWVVEQGLKPGDRVVIEGLQKVDPGHKVTVARWQPDAPDLAVARRAGAGPRQITASNG